MERPEAITLLAQLQDAQNRFYAGGDASAVAAALAPDVTWSVPGHSAIAGTYRGVDSVLRYFARRRDIADSTFRLHRRDVLTGAGDRIAALTDGTATIAGRERSWSTVGLYEIRGRLVAACWLLPLDPAEFDAIWSP
jgi:ketosteroid isomerase-like protein